MPRQTEAAVLCELGKPLRIMTLTIPDLKPGQVLVDVAYSGVCHAQLLEASGKRGPDRFLPHSLGHEGSGTVLAVGTGVAKVKPGDRVVLTWIKGNGAEVPSTVYQSSIGPVNAGTITTFMRQTVTCENRVVPIAETIPLREAVPLGCAISTGTGLVLNTANVQEDNTVAVFGVGGIGLSAIMGAHLRKAKMIIGIDVFDYKLELARQFGATHVINARQKEPLATILEMTSKRGVDYAVETAGTRGTMETAFQSVRDNGGLCILAGNLPSGELISLNPMDLIRGKRIVGSWGGATQPDRDIPRYAEYYLSGKLPLDRLLTHTYSLVDINKAMEDLESGKIGRALIDMSL